MRKQEKTMTTGATYEAPKTKRPGATDPDYCCATCGDWVDNGVPHGEGQRDLLAGRCRATGCQTPPGHCCGAWSADGGKRKREADRGRLEDEGLPCWAEALMGLPVVAERRAVRRSIATERTVKDCVTETGAAAVASKLLTTEADVRRAIDEGVPLEAASFLGSRYYGLVRLEASDRPGYVLATVPAALETHASLEAFAAAHGVKVTFAAGCMEAGRPVMDGLVLRHATAQEREEAGL